MGEVLKKILEKTITCYFTNEFIFPVFYAVSQQAPIFLIDPHIGWGSLGVDQKGATR